MSEFSVVAAVYDDKTLVTKRRRLVSGALKVAVSLLIMIAVGFLSNDDELLEAFNPLQWSLGYPPYPKAWVCVLLTALALTLAISEHLDRRKSEESLEADRARAAADLLGLREQTKQLQGSIDEERQNAEMRARAAQDELRTTHQVLQVTREELSNRTLKIEQSLQAGSDWSYIAGFDEVARDSQEAIMMVMRTPRAQRKYIEVLESIRYILFAAANLVKSYEGHPIRPIYTANIMVFRSIQSITPAIEPDLRSCMLVPDLFPDLRTLRGVLDLRVDLTASTESTREIRSDRRLKRLVLPVPRRYSEPDQAYALPGAPTAFCRKSMDVCPNVFDLPDRCEREGVLPPDRSSAIRSYFEEQAMHIRSFVSIPLFDPRDTDNPVGVVNINCDASGLLREQPRQRTILPNLRALLWGLPELISLLDTLPRDRRTQRSSKRPPRRG